MFGVVYGVHAVQSLVKIRPESILRVYLSRDSGNPRLQVLLKCLDDLRVPFRMISDRWISRQLERGSVHQGVLACVKRSPPPRRVDLVDLLSRGTDHLLLALDRITDPRNLGACLRCAAAAGVHAVILSREGSAQLGATARKVASGAAESVRVFRVASLIQTLRLVQRCGVRVVGAAAGAECLHRSNLTGSTVLVLGSEGDGLRGGVRACCDELVGIPTSGVMSSLNVSVAAGICLFEILRQRERADSGGLRVDPGRWSAGGIVS